jgi:branched-chain amino acid transport system ATP-binding protein
MRNDDILKVEDVHLSFRNIIALDGVNFEIDKKEILAIIGPNGAGKTALLNCINGFYRPQIGKVVFEGREISNAEPHEISKLGIARTFQRSELYTGLSVVDNLMAARHNLIKYVLFSAGVFFGWARNVEVAHRRRVEEIIDFLEMESIRKKVVGTLPYGLRKRVELGRALASDPKVILLDEPMSGMNLEEKEDMARFILDIYEDRNIPLVLVEHDMEVVMDISDRVIVLDFGKKIAEGPPKSVKQDPVVVRAYLGETE